MALLGSNVSSREDTFSVPRDRTRKVRVVAGISLAGCCVSFRVRCPLLIGRAVIGAGQRVARLVGGVIERADRGISRAHRLLGLADWRTRSIVRATRLVERVIEHADRGILRAHRLLGLADRRTRSTVWATGVAVLVYGLAVLVYGLAVLVYGRAVLVYGLTVLVYGLAVLVYGLAVFVRRHAVLVGREAVSVRQVAVLALSEAPGHGPWVGLPKEPPGRRPGVSRA